MSADDPDLDALIAHIAEGDPADWDGARARARSPAEARRVDTMHDLARVAEFHRARQREALELPNVASAGVVRWGELLLLERVGAGENGEVYRAWDATLQREVAVKLLRAADGSAMEEARALARVKSPHVVTIHGAAEHDGRAGLWMEFLHGPTLADRLARGEPLSADEVHRIAVALAHGLADVHRAGALHRDVKPSNVVLEASGRAVLTDFGTGRRLGAAFDAKGTAGTPLFMSPERLEGRAATAADDLYALGVTLWWALAGRAPFTAEDLAGLRAALAAGPRDALTALRPDAPAGLVRAIEHGMAPRAADRPAGAEAWAAELARAGVGTPRRSLRPLGVGIAVLAGLLLGWWAMRRPPAPQSAPAAPVAPAPPLPYDVSAAFARVSASGTTPLADGDRVHPGDALTLTLSTSAPVYAYVLDADERGECYLLFPQPLFDRTNPLPADRAVVLPGTRGGRPSAWQVTSGGGREHLLVVTSPTPVADLEAARRELAAPSPGHPVRYAPVGRAALDRLRGIGGVSDAPAAAPAAPGATLFDRVRALAGREQGVHGVWVRQVVLANPDGRSAR